MLKEQIDEADINDESEVSNANRNAKMEISKKIELHMKGNILKSKNFNSYATFLTSRISPTKNRGLPNNGVSTMKKSPDKINFQETVIFHGSPTKHCHTTQASLTDMQYRELFRTLEHATGKSRTTDSKRLEL